LLELNEKDRDFILKVLQKHCPDADYWVFGSRIKGTHRPYSDLDLAVVGQDVIPLSTMFEIKQSFAESDLPFKVDLVDFHQISDEFKSHILNKYEEL